MANWAADFLAHNPDLARWPAVRGRYGLGFRLPHGVTVSHFVGSPAHYWTHAAGWQALDTTLLRQPDGGYAAPGLPVRVYPDGTSTCGGYAQRSGRIGILCGGGRWQPIASLGPGHVDGDSIVREAPGFRHVVRVTEQGLREALHVERDVAGEPGDLLTLETQSRGALPPGYRFGQLVGIVDGACVPLAGGLPLELARAGAVLDPDYAADTADGFVQGPNRNSSDTYDTGFNYMIVGMDAFAWDRSFLKFSTSSIPDLDVIFQVNIKLVCTSDASATDFDVQIVKQNWSAQDPLDTTNREAAYDNCLAGTADDSIWRNTSGMSTNTQYTSGNLAPTWVSKTGSTYYSLRSSIDYLNTYGGGNAYISLATQDHATAGYRPLLAVTHAKAVARRMLLGVGW